MPLERLDLPAKYRCLCVTVVIHCPMVDSRAEVGELIADDCGKHVPQHSRGREWSGRGGKRGLDEQRKA